MRTPDAADERFLPERHVVGVLVYDAAGHLLLQQRDHAHGLRYPGWWTVFGGAVEPGETPALAIAREIAEELGAAAAFALRPVFLWSYLCPVRTHPAETLVRNHIFAAPLERGAGERLPLYEGQAKRWFAPAEARALRLAFEQQIVIARYFDHYAAALHTRTARHPILTAPDMEPNRR
jgi:8-oxo-dGTP pyrophosphatase MutT (NUDIX family)